MDLQKEEWESGIKWVRDRPCVLSCISNSKFLKFIFFLCIFSINFATCASLVKITAMRLLYWDAEVISEGKMSPRKGQQNDHKRLKPEKLWLAVCLPHTAADLSCLWSVEQSSSRRFTSCLDKTWTQEGRKGDRGRRQRERQRESRSGRTKGRKPEKVGEVAEARTQRKRGNGVYESVNDVIWADICSPWANLIGHSVWIGEGGKRERTPLVLDFGCCGTKVDPKK